MVSQHYALNNQVLDKSKYHSLKITINSLYPNLKELFLAKLYNFKGIELNKFERESDFLKKFIRESFLPYISCKLSAGSISDFKNIVCVNLKDFFSGSFSIDWTRKRFSGQVISMLINEGIVIEKVFLTTKGSYIVVKRNELGFLARFNFMN